MHKANTQALHSRDCIPHPPSLQQRVRAASASTKRAAIGATIGLQAFAAGNCAWAGAKASRHHTPVLRLNQNQTCDASSVGTGAGSCRVPWQTRTHSTEGEQQLGGCMGGWVVWVVWGATAFPILRCQQYDKTSVQCVVLL